MKLKIKNKPTIILNKDFQTILINVIFPFMKKEEEIAKINLLPRMLHLMTHKYPSEEEFTLVCRKNYLLANFCTCNTIGNLAYFTFHFMIPDVETLKENYLEKQFQIMHEMIYHPKTNHNQFDSFEFEKEKKNLYHDIEEILKDVNSYAMIKAKELVDDNHIFTNTIFNHQEQIESLTSKELYDFYCEKIINNNPAIYIFGKVNEKEMNQLCTNYLYHNNKITPPLDIFIKNYLPIKKEPQSFIEKSNFHNSIYIEFYKVNNMKEEDELYLGLIKDILSSSTSRLLNKQLRDNQELVYSSFAFNNANYGLLGICAIIQKNHIQVTKEKIKEVFNELKNEEEIEKALIKIKEKLRINLIKDLDEKTFLFRESVLKDLKLDITAKEYYEKALPITANDISKFTDRLILDTTYFLEEGPYESN